MDSKIFHRSMVTKNWTEDEIEAFALLLYKAVIQAHLARVKFKYTDEELQKLTEYLDLKIPIDRLRTNFLIFQCSAIDMVASRVRAGHSWRNFWGAPQWTLDLEPSFGIVEKALQVELLSAGPDPLARLLGELATAGEVAARRGGASEDAADALRDLPVARDLARVTAVPERCLAAAW
ncbi:uncharacterized protein LOC121737538 [Aricia agestis]|uniref:uncharacterized protein LOC121737538 n=1 Tax=Aricia agestis TaxID=91739 RepID=UPI001C20B4C5|nr:uncharacterized protein LOC121737538 [Aricia agestis]